MRQPSVSRRPTTWLRNLAARMRSSEWELQREYWRNEAPNYIRSHAGLDHEHLRALGEVAAQCQVHGLKTILDVGAGTGRGAAYLRRNGLQAFGVEPVKELTEVAVAEAGLPRSTLLQASALQLPFRDGSFDAVCATGVLHHIRSPNRAVLEMLRVARRAVFISDSNRFGQGPLLTRYLKVVLAKAGLWSLVNGVRTRGRGFQISDGDGLFYSYSVYDSLEVVVRSAERVVLMDTDGRCSSSWLQPLVTSEHVLLVAWMGGNQPDEVETSPL